MFHYNFSKMGHYIKMYCRIILLLCLFTSRGFAQLQHYNDNKEKIYIHTNHVFFQPGENLFFKIYVISARDQSPSAISRVVYVEVLNPSGNVLKKLKYRVEDGYAEGQYTFGEELNGGIYRLRAYTSWMQNESEQTWFSKEITLQKVIAPRILMKLDFPKKGYGAGDEVAADYSIRNLANQPIKNYEAKYTVSLGGATIQTNTFKTDTAGKAQIKFKLPATLNTNDGILNVTVSYDSYTEAISRSIPITWNKIDLQFMPEGGTLVEGITTNIAFKALNENGKPADIRGIITDSLGTTVASFDSYHNGMGQFSFTPGPGQSYTARITAPAGISQSYKLPQVIKNGIVMNLTGKDSLLLFRIVASKSMHITLTGQSRDKVYFSKEISLRKGEQLVEVNPAGFPSGIARFTITDDYQTPLAERITFLHHNRILQVKITADKEKYLPREKISLKLKTLDENGRPVPSNFSLAVIDDKLWSLADDKQDHILSWLLMSSELHGKIEEPQFYFKKEEKKAVPALDLVMLTHGYRYFDYIDYVSNAGKTRYNPDLNNILSGVVKDLHGQPVKAVVYLVDISSNKTGSNRTIIKQETNKDGIFFFTDISPEASYQLIARSVKHREKVTIKVQQHGTGYIPLPIKNTIGPFNDDRLPPPLIAKNDTKKEKALAEMAKDVPVLFDGDTKRLEEVVVVGLGVARKSNLTGAISIVKASPEQTSKDPLSALQGKAAGLQITGPANSGAAAQVQIRGIQSISGNQQPLIIVDGVPCEKMEAIAADDIESISVLKDAAATAPFGSRGAAGVILITSKSFRNKRLRLDLTRTYYYKSEKVDATGNFYDVARRFYAPRYHSPLTTVRDDFRETIYWNPVVQTDKDGEASLEFYNSDATTTFRAIAEGLSVDGTPGRTEMTYAVQNVMSVDVKIPPYLTVGDHAHLPLVIKNNSAASFMATVEVTLPEKMQADDFEKKVFLPANGSAQVLIPVMATGSVKGDIKFTVSGPSNTEKISLPIEVAQKGFPVITTISGNKETDLSFNIGRIVPGSLQSELKTFSSIEGQLMEGIESMLREPYGCFEQTSSSTYPNILILKYLRESGKSNREIQKKALDYIEKGYKRLIGFETSMNGFEWFGHTPPHEALTAYGLLEFTDMQDFISVDKQMLDRTKTFLLSRRNRKGTFDLVKKGYDAFAAVPDKIANIYIVYALTQAGIGNQIQLEYQTAVSQAMESRDAYQLGMMALAASNMHNEKDYKKLMEMLEASKLNAETSVVNSRAVSLEVETMSLYVMALAREKSPRLALMANLVTKIMSKKSYYGYGSTQATVLALQAIVTYYQVAGAINANAKMEIRLNNKPAATGKNMITDIKEGANTFSVRYASDKETIPYNMEVSYYTFQPPTSPEAELQLDTRLNTTKTKVGETVRMDITVKNIRSILQPMVIAKIGIPAGLTAQSWQLKEIMEKNHVAFYETFDNYLVLYWMGFGKEETKTISLDLKAEVPGTYKAKAGNTYLYYTPEFKFWEEGKEITITP